MSLRSLVEVIADLIAHRSSLIARRWVGIAHPFFLQEKLIVELPLDDMLDKSYFER